MKNLEEIKWRRWGGMKDKLPPHLETRVDHYAPTRKGCMLGIFLMSVSAVISGIGFWLLINWALDFWR